MAALAATFAANSPNGYLGVTINTGAGFGFITMEQRGLTSGKESGAVVQVQTAGPGVVPQGVAGAPHAVNSAGASPFLLLFGTGYPVSAVIPLHRNGVAAGTAATNSAGRFFVGITPANTGNTSAVWGADNGAGTMSGASMEERSDAGTPPVGDQNAAWAFVDRPIVNSASGGTVGIVGENFVVGETVTLSGCGAGAPVADANGAVGILLTVPAVAAAYNCVLTGTSGRIARASVLAAANVPTRRGLILQPSSVIEGPGTITVLATRMTPSNTANIYLNGNLQGSATTNASGIGTFVMAKPSATPTPGVVPFLHSVAWIESSGSGDAIATALLVAPVPEPDPERNSCNSHSTPNATPTPTPTATASPTPGCFGTVVENFDDITLLVPNGWAMTNNSVPVGTTGWFQGNPDVFPAQAGPTNAYIGANFNNVSGTNTISNWLMTPVLTLVNGETLTFYTRTTDGTFPDRLQVRMSTAGASTNVGSGPTGVGDFGTVPEGGTGNGVLLLDINPTYTSTGYPIVWTQFTVPITGVPAPTSGRLAFRYFVENGGTRRELRLHWDRYNGLHWHLPNTDSLSAS